MKFKNSLLLNDNNEIPQLGLGVFQASDEEAEAAVLEALKIGYRLIDTAAIYKNEKGVGNAIKKATIPRQEIFVTTKLWNDDQGYEKAFIALDQSLQKLGLDYIDLYLIHWPSPQRNLFVETWRALIEMKGQGKIKSIGVSNFTIENLQEIMDETKEIPVLNQVELHPRFQQSSLRAFQEKYGIKTESWSPLGRGRFLLDPALLAIAEKHKKTAAQIIIRWHLQSGLIVIPKSITPSRIKENFLVFDFTLDNEDLQTIANLDSNFGRIGPNPWQRDF